MPKTKTRLWYSNGGRVACESHMGGYATAQMRANPRARKLVTPLDVWWILPKADRAETWADCETCGARMDSK